MRRTRRVARGKKTKSSKCTKYRSSRMSRRGGTRPRARGKSTKGSVLGIPRRSRARNQRPTPALSVPVAPPIPKVPVQSAYPLASLPSLSASPSSPSSPRSPITYPEKKKNKGKQRVKVLHDLLSRTDQTANKLRLMHSGLSEEDKRKADARNKTLALKKLLGVKE